MSLQHIHLLFVLLSTMLCAVLTILFFASFRQSEQILWLWTGVVTLISTVVLPAYGVYFYKKLVRMGIYL